MEFFEEISRAKSMRLSKCELRTRLDTINVSSLLMLFRISIENVDPFPTRWKEKSELKSLSGNMYEVATRNLRNLGLQPPVNIFPSNYVTSPCLFA